MGDEVICLVGVWVEIIYRFLGVRILGRVVCVILEMSVVFGIVDYCG